MRGLILHNSRHISHEAVPLQRQSSWRAGNAPPPRDASHTFFLILMFLKTAGLSPPQLLSTFAGPIPHSFPTCAYCIWIIKASETCKMRAGVRAATSAPMHSSPAHARPRAHAPVLLARQRLRRRPKCKP